MADRIVCVSRATKEECIKRGVQQDKIKVIPNGINDEIYINEDKRILRKEFEKKFKINLNDKKVLLSVGRLMKRKGIHWFVYEVIPLILEEFKNFIYLIVGAGPMKNRIEEIIKEKKLENRVVLFGKIDDRELKLIYNICDIFIMPNIHIERDFEGFGIVAIEAASCKVPVVASCIEGITDALMDGKIGSLVISLDAIKFSREILKLLKDDELRRKKGEEARKLVINNFLWEKVIREYGELLEGV